MPVQRSYDSVLQPLNIESDLTVDLEAPGWECLSTLLKPFDAIDAHVSSLVDSSLQVHSVRMHNDRNQVVIFAGSLLFPV